MKITLKIYEDGKEVLAKIFDEGVYRAGRSDFSDIVLSDENVSRSHLELRVTESAVYMTNMSSAGKVKLNSRAVETAELADGDELSVGPFRIVVFHGERDVPAAAPALPTMPDNDQPPGSSDENAMAGMGEGDANGESPAEGPALQALEGGGEDAFPQYQPEPAPPPLMEMDSPVVEGTAALARAETQVEIKPVVAKLMFVEGSRAGEEIFLEAYEVTFGRSKKADIYLDDEKLSRIHAKVTRVGMGYRLIDLNSRNGTYVNGMRVLEHPLSSFDVIEIGNSKIKFLIHDIMGGEMGARQASNLVPANAVEQTRSLQLVPDAAAQYMELPSPAGAPAPAAAPQASEPADPDQAVNYFEKSKPNRIALILGAIAVLGALYLVIPSGEDKPAAKVAETKKELVGDPKLPAALPKEYLEMTPDAQRSMEGLYNSAQKYAEREQYEEAVASLKKIHDFIPHYKNSRELQEQYLRKLKEKQVAEAQEKAKRDEKQDLAIYLEEGLEYLKEGDFDRAAEAFNSAIVIDPTNQTAIRGLKAAEYKVKRLEDIPPEKDPEQEKRKLVAELFQKAVAAFTVKSYQEAIDTANKIREIELQGDTQYLNEAKQIIDRARMLQKEEFEPFLIQAKEKYAEGDYNASRDLCEEMLKRDGAYEEAKDCVLKAKKQLQRLAKEAYTHGYILESMNRIEEAKQYWNRAKNYVRPGDDYHDKVLKKLEYYQ